jgi:hypothetical protein
MDKKQQINELANSKSGTSVAPETGRLVISKVVDLTGWLRDLSPLNWTCPGKQKGPVRPEYFRRKYAMKKYVKPSLTSLGLLRVVTQFSCEPVYTQRSY